MQVVNRILLPYLAQLAAAPQTRPVRGMRSCGKSKQPLGNPPVAREVTVLPMQRMVQQNVDFWHKPDIIEVLHFTTMRPVNLLQSVENVLAGMSDRAIGVRTAPPAELPPIEQRQTPRRLVNADLPIECPELQ
jgi:hypothetical protein